jgi:hypothetical protein
MRDYQPTPDQAEEDAQSIYFSIRPIPMVLRTRFGVFQAGLFGLLFRLEGLRQLHDFAADVLIARIGISQFFQSPQQCQYPILQIEEHLGV